MLQDDVSVREQGFAVLDEVRPLEPELKSALYAAYELAGATKAALYLAASYTSERYEVVTSYAFNPGSRKVVDGKDPLVHRLAMTHSPLVINALAEDELVAEVLFRQNHDRLIAVPIFGRGRRMVGFVDLRDKAGKRNFEAADVAAAERVMQEIVHVLASKNLYGVGRVPLVDMAEGRKSTGSGVNEVSRIPLTKEKKEAHSAVALSTEAIEVIRIAHDRMTQRDLAIDRRRRILTAEEFDRVRLLLPAALAIPGVAAAALTSLSGGESQAIVTHGEPTVHTLKLIRQQIAKWAGQTLGELSIVPVIMPSRTCAPLNHDQLRTVASSQLAPRAVERLILTIAFERVPDETTRVQIERFAEFLGDSVEAIIGRMELQAERLAMAECLLEPDFNRYEGLADHSKLVSAISHRFATVLSLRPHDIETVRIAALVHDVGLRLLDYKALTAAKDLSDDQKHAVSEHPLVGAALVEPILGPDVALAVLRHHERIDGKGYPGRVPGDRIPIAAKIIAIADAWVAMTSPWHYVRGVSEGDAVAQLREGAGTQFDETLVGPFLAERHEIAGTEE